MNQTSITTATYILRASYTQQVKHIHDLKQVTQLKLVRFPSAQKPPKVYSHKHCVGFLVYKTWQEVPRAAC